MLRVVVGSKDAFFGVGQVLLKATDIKWQVQSTLESNEGDILLIMGSKNLIRYQELGLVAKGRVVKSMRGQVFILDKRYVLFTYDPYMKNIEYQAGIDIEWDIRLVIRLCRIGNIDAPIGEYKYVDNFKIMINEIHEKYQETKKKVSVAVDLETVGLDAYNLEAFIVSIAFTVIAGTAYVMRFKDLFDEPEGEALEQIQWLLNDQIEIKIVGANLKFDIRWLRKKWGVICTNFSFDTMVVGSLLDENASNSLENHAKRYTCLSGRTRVFLPDRTTMRIKDMVVSRYTGDVLSYNGVEFVVCKVVNWFKNVHLTGKWFAVFLKGFTCRYGRYTGDHLFVTEGGDVQVKDLAGSTVITGYDDFAGDSLQVFLGSMLGDGGIERRGNYGRMGLYARKDREDYLSWKAKGLGVGCRMYCRGGLWTYRFGNAFSRALCWWDDYLIRVPGHRHNKPVPTRKVLEQLGPLGFAVWYQDDGSLLSYGGAQIRCCVSGYEDGAVSYMQELFGEGVTFWKNGTFVFSKKAAKRFFAYIRPYIHPCFADKVPYVVEGVPEIVAETAPLKVEVAYVRSEKVYQEGEYISYCIEVQGTHNFITLQGVVKNCMGGYDSYLNRTYDKSRMDLVPDGDFLNYSGGDTDACIQVMRVFREMLLKDTALVNFYVELLHPAVRAFEGVENEGILLDVGYYAELQKEVGAAVITAEEKAVALMSNFLKYKYSGKNVTGQNNLRLSRGVVIKDFMFGARGLNLTSKKFTPKTGEPSTALEHLMMFQDEPKAEKFIEVLREHNSAKKTLSTYIVGFLKHLKYDTRFHPVYQMFHGAYGDKGDEAGAVTGRSSVRDPAVQCSVGDSAVYTGTGKVRLLDIVEGFERGESFLVTSHTGAWKRVIGVYRNGVKPVFKVTTKLGLFIECTGNHPLLLQEGFVRTDDIIAGDLVYVDKNWGEVQESGRFKVSSTYDNRFSKKQKWSNAVFMRMSVWCKENSFLAEFNKWRYKVLWLFEKGKVFCSWSWQKGAMQDLWAVGWDVAQGAGNNGQKRRCQMVFGGNCLRAVGRISELFKRYGRVPERSIFGSSGQQQGILQRKLSMGNGETVGAEQKQQYIIGVWGQDSLCGRMGRGNWIGGKSIFSAESRVVCGGGIRDAKRAKAAGFSLDSIMSIEYTGSEETYGITVEDDQSYISDGIVVHNTLPHYTKWAKKLRRGYIAPPGFVILAWDYSQGELRIVAIEAKEETMLRLYKQGLDQHMVTGGKIAGYSINEMLEMKQVDLDLYKKIRQAGKSCNFGFVFGMHPKGFREYVRINFQLKISLEEAAQRRQAFFDLYSRLLLWHDEQIDFARRNGYVRSPLGRVRHLPMIHSQDMAIRSKEERRSINSPIQGTLSDMTIYALSRFRKKYGNPDGCRFFLFTHDELCAYIRIDEMLIWKERVRDIMENLPLTEKFGWELPIKFPVGIEAGKNLGDIMKVETFIQKEKNWLYNN